jgi:hypothetical protein
MNLNIATLSGQLNDGLRQYVEQRLRAGPLRFEHGIARAAASFSDLSGPYGAEQQCLLVLSLARSGEVSIERRGPRARLALGRVVETAIRKLRRRFKANGMER